MAKFKDILRNIPVTVYVIASVFLVTAGIIVLLAFSNHASGTVVSKHIVAAHNETTVSCTMVGKVTVCLPNTHEVETTYVLSLADGKDKGSADVSKDVYNTTNVGTYFKQ